MGTRRSRNIMVDIYHFMCICNRVGARIFSLPTRDPQARNPDDSPGLLACWGRSSHSRLVFRKHPAPLEPDLSLYYVLSIDNLDCTDSTSGMGLHVRRPLQRPLPRDPGSPRRAARAASGRESRWLGVDVVRKLGLGGRTHTVHLYYISGLERAPIPHQNRASPISSFTPFCGVCCFAFGIQRRTMGAAVVLWIVIGL